MSATAWAATRLTIQTAVITPRTRHQQSANEGADADHPGVQHARRPAWRTGIRQRQREKTRQLPAIIVPTRLPCQHQPDQPRGQRDAARSSANRRLGHRRSDGCRRRASLDDRRSAIRRYAWTRSAANGGAAGEDGQAFRWQHLGAGAFSSRPRSTLDAFADYVTVTPVRWAARHGYPRWPLPAKLPSMKSRCGLADMVGVSAADR